MGRIEHKAINNDYISNIADEYASQFYNKDANPISYESLTEPFINGFKKAIETIRIIDIDGKKHRVYYDNGIETIEEIKESPGPDRAKELANQHWSYIKSLLVNHKVGNIEEIGFHYVTSFIHGYKHGIEDSENEREN